MDQEVKYFFMIANAITDEWSDTHCAVIAKYMGLDQSNLFIRPVD